MEERRANHRDLVEHYREHLIATGAEGVLDPESAFDQVRLWVMYGIQAWVANADSAIAPKGMSAQRQFRLNLILRFL